MKSPKNKTQVHRTKVKKLSTLLAIGLAVITLFQAGHLKSEKVVRTISMVEADLIAEVDDWFAVEAMDLEQQFLEEAKEEAENYKVYDTDGTLLMEGNPSQNEALRKLVNQAEFMSKFANQQYYTLTK